tara:strand:- start:902583 stop:904502 length:1920 start_codon:yes stop_codon:yes gene_type:complete
MTEAKTDFRESFDRVACVNMMAILITIAASAIACLHPFAPYEDSALADVLWITSQSAMLVSIGWMLAGIGVRFRNDWLIATGKLGMIAIPTVILCDSIAYGWIREHFVSAAMFKVATELSPRLWQHASAGTIRGGLGLLVFWIALITCVLLISRFASRHRGVGGKRVPIVFGLATLAAATPVWMDLSGTLSTMRENPARHPLCMLSLIRHDEPPYHAALDDNAVSNPTHSPSAPIAGNQSLTKTLKHGIEARKNQHRLLAVSEIPKTELADVLIVVVESFRHELICEEVMPNLWQFSQQGTHCRQHFSGGNATNHGMFSLLSGLESIWYDSDVRFTPIMNRLMRQAGYELGFFAGHDDWRLFQMDGFISPEQFDVFRISKPNGLSSDRRATELAANFLDRTDRHDDAADWPPRLAVLYLYATHADYKSYPDDQVFAPAADDRFLIPFTAPMRQSVWNRYRNSARTVDRFLSAVMRKDRVVIVTGDHGESFLEDGVCGHGVRISAYQNMTPAVIYHPGGRAKAIDLPTMHADLLPTLTSILGIKLNSIETLDGVNLDNKDDSSLRSRVFSTRNYLSDDVALIAGSHREHESFFALQGQVSLRDGKAIPLNAIDKFGQRIRLRPDPTAKGWQAWLDARFQP